MSNYKDFAKAVFEFKPETKASEVRDFLATKGINLSEHQCRAYKALATKANA